MGDSGDVNMNDGLSDVKPIYYRTPNPPGLPPTTKINGIEHDTVWTKDSRHYVAHRSMFRTGYTVFQDIYTTTHPEMWPYRLGAPSTTARCDPLSLHWGLQILEDAGFINYSPNGPGINYDPRGPEDLEYPKGRWVGDGDTWDDNELEERIHPLLREEHWRDIDPNDYSLLLPAILMASALLEAETTLAFFYALSSPDCWYVFEDPKRGSCVNVKVPETLSEAQQWTAFEKLEQMGMWTSWGIAENGVDMGNAYASCRARRVSGKFIEASAPLTFQTDIVLSPVYLTVLEASKGLVCQGQAYQECLDHSMDVGGVPEDRKIKIDPSSARSRTTLHLALTMIHELAHAFGKAHFPDTSSGHTYHVEPWLAENRSNEMGYSWEQRLMGGVLLPLEVRTSSLNFKDQNIDLVYAPFGFYFNERWDLTRPELERTRERMKTIDPAGYERQNLYYPIPQRHIHEMYTKEMWLRQIPRFGWGAIKVPKIRDWAYIFGGEAWIDDNDALRSAFIVSSTIAEMIHGWFISV